MTPTSSTRRHQKRKAKREKKKRKTDGQYSADSLSTPDDGAEMDRNTLRPT